MKRAIFRIHKWVGVSVGIFFAIWLISGIVMVLPQSWFSEEITRPHLEPIKFQDMTISPAEALQQLKSSEGSSIRVQTISLLQISENLVYRIKTPGGESHLVDARSGKRMTITEELAEHLARRGRVIDGKVVSIEHIAQHNTSYPWGPLPVYELQFDDDRATRVHVGLWDGRVRYTDHSIRIYRGITSLHEFMPMKLVIDSDAVRIGFLVFVSLIGIGVAGTGYYLAFKKTKRS